MGKWGFFLLIPLLASLSYFATSGILTLFALLRDFDGCARGAFIASAILWRIHWCAWCVFGLCIFVRRCEKLKPKTPGKPSLHGKIRLKYILIMVLVDFAEYIYIKGTMGRFLLEELPMEWLDSVGFLLMVFPILDLFLIIRACFI